MVKKEHRPAKSSKRVYPERKRRGFALAVRSSRRRKTAWNAVSARRRCEQQMGPQFSVTRPTWDKDGFGTS
jgi:hypothetical protein